MMQGSWPAELCGFCGESSRISIVGALGAKPEEGGSIRVYYDCPDCRTRWWHSYLAPDGPDGQLILSPIPLGAGGPGAEPLYPVAACPSCPLGVAHPFQLAAEPTGTGTTAFYECPKCSHEWHTTWKFDAISKNCPGCAICAPYGVRA